MRTYHVIVIVAVILAGLGAQIFFTSPSSEAPGMAIGAMAQAPAGNFTQDCARKEISVIALIEDHGAAGDLSAERLGQAGLTMLNARQACYEGRVDEALALYGHVLNLAPVASLNGQRR